jgi:RecJ-like exonuclease
MVVVLTHGDSDGICSAALVKARYPHAKVILSRPVSLNRDLQEFLDEDLVFVCDVAINRSKKKELDLIAQKLGKRLKYLDHHPIQLKGHKNPKNKSTSQITYELLGKDLSEDFYLIAVLGAIADYLPTKFVEKAYTIWGKELIDLEYSVLTLGLDESRGWFKLTVIDELSNGKYPTDIPALVRKSIREVENERNIRAFVRSRVEKKGKIAYVVDPPGRGSSGKAAVLARTYGDKPIGLCARNVHGEIDISLRAEKVNLSKVVIKAAEKVGGSGGGHSNAAGATIPGKKLKQFMDELNKLIRWKET